MTHSSTTRFTCRLSAVLTLIFAVGSLYPFSLAMAASADSVSQHGVTWYFDRQYEVGQYANGDWWVLGPVTITRITPESRVQDGRTINGTQVNPSHNHRRNLQGYDSSPLIEYSGELNKAPSMKGPLNLSEASVVSTISTMNPPSGSWSAVTEVAILTVVTAVPPIGAFRPHPYGTDKTSYWTEADLRYSILLSLPLVSNTPNIVTRASQMLRFWNEQAAGNWQQGGVKGVNNQPNYGRELANRIGENLLLLHLDYPISEKRDLYVGLVQYGLDNYGRMLMGDTWWADGGINHGRKLPMVIAGLALNDPDVLDMANRDRGPNRFQEDGQTFIVTQADVDTPRASNMEPYTSDMIGTPEWGIRYWQDPSRADASWNATYRYVGSGFVAHALAIRMTPGGVDAWNWTPFFDYADRFQALGGIVEVGNTNGVTRFAQAMWDAYRNADLPEPAAAPKPPSLQID